MVSPSFVFWVFMNIQWYPGHMTKAKRQLAEQLKRIDMVIEVLDARLPLGSQNPDFDDLFAGKKRFYMLNKADLADDALSAAWIAHFAAQGITAQKYSAQRSNPAALMNTMEKSARDITQRFEQKGVHKTVRALIAGIPNVGKSAILNRLSGTRKVKEGNKPGVTKGLQWVKLSPYFEIMDTPGILMPKIENEETAAKIALIGCVKQEILDEENLAYYLISFLQKTKPGLLIDRYNLEDLDKDAYEVLGDIAKKRGFLLKGGLMDYERAAKTVLDEFKNGKLGRLTLEVPHDA